MAGHLRSMHRSALDRANIQQYGWDDSMARCSLDSSVHELPWLQHFLVAIAIAWSFHALLCQ